MIKDLYKVLGCERDATQEQLRHNYLRLAKRYHPDVSEEADAKRHFQEVNQAYTILSDSFKRKRYDRRYSFFLAMQTHQQQMRSQFANVTKRRKERTENQFKRAALMVKWIGLTFALFAGIALLDFYLPSETETVEIENLSYAGQQYDYDGLLTFHYILDVPAGKLEMESRKEWFSLWKAGLITHLEILRSPFLGLTRELSPVFGHEISESEQPQIRKHLGFSPLPDYRTGLYVLSWLIAFVGLLAFSPILPSVHRYKLGGVLFFLSLIWFVFWLNN